METRQRKFERSSKYLGARLSETPIGEEED